jgi:hypothetical protein
MLSFCRVITHSRASPHRPVFKDELMKTRILRLSDADDALFMRWQDLAEHAIEPNVCMDPRILAPGGIPNAAVRDMSFLIAEDGTRLLGVMAIEVGQLHVLRLPFTAVQLGTVPYTSRRFPLIAASHPAETVTAFIEAIRRERLASVLDLENFPRDGPLHEAFCSAAGMLHIPLLEIEVHDYAFALRDHSGSNPDAPTVPSASGGERPARLPLERLGSSSRKSYGRAFRGLERATGCGLTYSDRGNDPAAITEFLDLQAAGWKGDVSHGGGAFRVTGWDPWFVATTDAFRATGQLSVYTLSAGTRTLYMQVAVRSGTALVGLQDAYDETYAEFGAGNLGRLVVLNHAMKESDIEFFDPNVRPVYVESTRLYPNRRRFGRLVLSVGGISAGAALRLAPVAQRSLSRFRRLSPPKSLRPSPMRSPRSRL